MPGRAISPDGRTIAYVVRAGDGAGDWRRHAAADDWPTQVLLYDVAAKTTRDATGGLRVDPGAARSPGWRAACCSPPAIAPTSSAYELDLASGRATAP